MGKRAEVFFLVFVLSACAGADPRDMDRTSIERGREPSPAAVAILDDGSGDGGPPDPQPPIDIDV